MSSSPTMSDQQAAKKPQNVSARITAEVTSWPGVKAGFGSRGEWAFTVGEQSIGHLHGDRVAHFGFPRELGAQLRQEGRVGPHPVNPHSTKMAAKGIQSEEALRDVVALLRLNYERTNQGGR